MVDDLTIIKRVIDEHRIIREHVKLVGDSIPDEEAIASLTRSRPDWIPGRPDVLFERQNRLKRTLSFLDEGLKNHFAFEEEALPPLFGELLMQALLLEHQEVRKGIDEAKARVADTELEGLSRDELISRESLMQQTIDNLAQLLEEHAAREETILEMIKRALEEKHINES